MTLDRWGTLLLLMLTYTYVCDAIKLNFNAKESIRYLGYNPDVRVIRDSTISRYAGNQPHPTLYVNGWGPDRQWHERWLKKSDLLVMPAITFKMPDDDQKSTFALTKSSFGQLSDVAPILYILKKCYLAGCTGIDLFGFSRGGATILNALAILHTKSYPQSLKELGIDDTAATGILSMVQNGCITLDAPLKHMYPVIRSKIRKTRTNIVNTICTFCSTQTCQQSKSAETKSPRAHASDYTESFIVRAIDTIGAYLVYYIILPAITRYKPWQIQAIDSARELSSLHLTFLINYEYCDAEITDYGNKELYTVLSQDHTTYCVQSNDKAHAGTRKTLPEVFHAFKQIYGYQPIIKKSKDCAQSLLAQYKPDITHVLEH